MSTEEPTNLDQLIDHSQEYLKTRQDLARMQAAEKIAMAGSSAASGMVMLALFGSVFLFASVAGALYLGDRLQNTALGFLVMSGIYFVLALFLFAFREPLIRRPIENSFIKNFFKGDHETN